MFYIILCLIAVLWILYYTTFKIICKNKYTVYSEKIKRDLKIVQISDVHSELNDSRGQKLFKKVQEEKPDVIMLTGDIFDLKEKGAVSTLRNIQKLKSLADNICYVVGNHEAKEKELLKTYINLMKEAGIKVLRNESVLLSENVFITGVDDPSMTSISIDNNLNTFKRHLNSIKVDENKFNILLTHRPDYFEECLEYDLVLTGHTHGGQWRIPFVVGFYSPGQGYFPKYCKGLYKKLNSTLIVSPGLGNGVKAFRLFNPTSIEVINIKTKEKA